MKRARDLATAVRVAQETSTSAGLPRCTHYRWTLDPHGVARWDRLCGGRGKRGRVPPCTCRSARDVDPECPHVTWTAVAVVELDGDALLIGNADVLDAHPEAAAMPMARAARERLDEAVPRYTPEQVREAVRQTVADGRRR